MFNKVTFFLLTVWWRSPYESFAFTPSKEALGGRSQCYSGVGYTTHRTAEEPETVTANTVGGCEASAQRQYADYACGYSTASTVRK